MIGIAALNIYPVKSCGGIALSQVELSRTGFANDRRWMVVNEQRRFLTQREVPTMALVAPALQDSGVVLSAPGMPPLSVLGVATERPVEVIVWRDRAAAFDEGDQAAEWFSGF